MAPSRAAESAERRLDKVAARRDELAMATSKTLSELGYAQTSLREIAANSDYSHGVLHYYFSDKVDLITHCVRLYKAECVTRYDDLLVTTTSAEDLRSAFADRLADTVQQDQEMHRLWYDLRNQSMFEHAFDDEVRQIDLMLEQMIERIVARYAQFAGRAVAVDSAVTYSTIDGLFVRALGRLSRGDLAAAQELRDQAFALLPRFLT